MEEKFIKGATSPLSPPERRGCKGRLKSPFGKGGEVGRDGL